MAEEILGNEERLMEIIEQEKKKEKEKGEKIEEVVAPEAAGREEEEIPTYIDVFADIAAKRMGLDKNSILRAVKDIIKSDDPGIRKLVKLTQISNILSNLKRMGGLTSEVTDISMARLASQVTNELGRVLAGDDADEMSRMFREVKKFVMQMALMREMMRTMGSVLGGEDGSGGKQSDSSEDMSVLMSMISNLESKISKLEEEIKTTKSEKSFFDRIRETVDSTVSSTFSKIEEKMSALEARIKELEEEKKKKEMEDIIKTFREEIKKVKSDMEELKKSISSGIASLGAGSAAPPSITDLISEYKRKVEELDKARRELDVMLSKMRAGKEGGVSKEMIREIEKLRAEVENLRKRADIMDTIGNVLKDPKKIRDWIDTAVSIVQKVSALRNAFVGEEVSGAQQEQAEEVSPPEILKKIVEEEEGGGGSGEPGEAGESEAQ